MHLQSRLSNTCPYPGGRHVGQRRPPQTDPWQQLNVDRQSALVPSASGCVIASRQLRGLLKESEGFRRAIIILSLKLMVLVAILSEFQTQVIMLMNYGAIVTVTVLVPVVI